MRLVLLHGFTQTGASWRPVADRLRATYEVDAPDLPGHGTRSGLRADLWESARLVATGPPAVCVGYSMGARLALHVALLAPGWVRGLVLLGATAGIDDPGERAARRAADEELASDIERTGTPAFLERWLDQPLLAGLEPEPDDLAARRANDPEGLASALRLAGTATMDPPLWDRLHEISCPTLVLAGERDQKFTALGRRIARGIGEHATFAQIVDAGHAAHLEQPHLFATTVTEWVSRSVPDPA